MRTAFPSTPVTIAVDRARAAVDGNVSVALQGCPDLLTVLNEDGVIRYVSGSVLQLLGLTSGQVVGRSLHELVAPEDRRNFAAWTAHAWAGSTPPELIHRMVRADGGLECFETRMRSSGVGTRRRLVAVSREAQDRATLDRRLTSLLRLWEQIGDAVQEGIVVLDDEHTILAANRAAGELLRQPASALLGAALSDVATMVTVDDAVSTGDVRLSRTTVDTAVMLTSVRPERPFVLSARARTLARTGDTSARIILLFDHDGVRPLAPRHSANAGRLSRREAEVLRCLADGLDVHAISGKLGISIHTVRAYVKSILKKLDARNQLQAVVIALREQLLDMPKDLDRSADTTQI